MSNETPQQAARRFATCVIRDGFVSQALHEYQSADGKPLYWRMRLKRFSDNTKWIRPMHWNEKSEFVLSEPKFDGKKPLYRLPEIINPSFDSTVWIVEGEWCADHLAKHGVIATTSGSADSAARADWSVLANRKIIIWPDNDAAGLKYAEEVTQQLRTFNCEINWIDIVSLNLAEKDDCVDWLEINLSANATDLLNLPTIKPVINNQANNKLAYFENPFRVTEDGVFYCADDNQFRICSKLQVMALTRDDQSENWGRLLQFYDADKQIHNWAMPMQMLTGSGEELCSELMRLGLEIAPGRKNHRLLLDYINSTQHGKRALCVNRTGWYKSVFVLPEATLGESNECVLYQSENRSRDYKQSGTLNDWQQHIAKNCAGNSRLILAISCAFAAMLMHHVGAESGGIHFIGESSTGKTTALRIAASVFGAPDYLHRWRATTNGLEALAASRSDTLLILDELAQVDAKEAGEIAYMLANGMGKARAAKNGGARSRHEWRLLFLSAGEVGLAQHMREGGKSIKAGQEVRLVDIPADSGKGFGIYETLYNFTSAAEFNKSLLEATHHYYGTAAFSFLQQITKAENLKQLPKLIQQLRQQFLKVNLPVNACGQVHRVCERFALIAAGGKIATDYGITGWSSNEAKNAAQKCFQDWIQHRGGVDNHERKAILSQVKSFFEAHGESRFSNWNDTESRTLNRAGFKRIESNTTNFYVLTEAFRKDICQGFDHRIVARFLTEAGWIDPAKEGTHYRREYLPGMGRTRCYLFTAKMWESE